MKKLLGISLVAILAATPLMARAADGDPVGTGETPVTETGTAVKATDNAPFALIGSNEATDRNAATAGYVKGAYNAAIKAVNTVHDEAAAAQAAAQAAAAAAVYTGADGINITNNEVSVDLTENKGLQIDATSKKLEIKDGAGIKTGANGVEVDLTSNGGLETDTNGQLKVVVNNDTVGLNASGQLEVKTGSLDTTYIDSGAKAEGTQAGAENTKLTTQGYVDEAVAGINTNITNNLATKTGVEATIKNTNISVGEFALASGAVSGSITVPMMDDWSHPDTANANGLQITGNAIALNVGTDINEGTVAIDDTSVSYSTTVNQ